MEFGGEGILWVDGESNASPGAEEGIIRDTTSDMLIRRETGLKVGETVMDVNGRKKGLSPKVKRSTSVTNRSKCTRHKSTV
jgi:hypothetical protein